MERWLHSLSKNVFHYTHVFEVSVFFTSSLLFIYSHSLDHFLKSVKESSICNLQHFTLYNYDTLVCVSHVLIQSISSVEEFWDRMMALQASRPVPCHVINSVGEGWVLREGEEWMEAVV